MKTNVTVSLDALLLREVKVLAARRGTSISSLLAEELEKTVRDAKDYEAAKRRSLSRMRRAADLGWRPAGSREAVHERGR